VYDVELTVPDTHVVVGGGVLTAARDEAGGTRVYTYRAEDVHDFAWMADPWMKIATGKAHNVYGDVEVRVVHRPEQAAYAPRHVEAAVRTVEMFSKLFVPYPYAIITVIDPPGDASGSAGGMEYPTLVTTAGDVAIPRVWFAEQVTIHEVGHNWFQGMLASNEVDEAFLDEGINEYADGLVADDWFGPDRSTADSTLLRIGYYAQHRVMGDAQDLISPIATKSYEFAPGEYGAVTYGKTALAMKTLENIVGRDRFLAAMGLYARRFAFKHPTRADLFASLREGLGEDVGWFLEPAFLRPGGIDYRLGPILVRPERPPRGVFGDGDGRKVVPDDGDDERHAKEWRSEITVMNVGSVPAPVEVELRLADGTASREEWDGRGGWKRFEVVRPSRLVEVTIDPDGKVVLEHSVLDNSWRDPPQSGASWRAAARLGFWEQTILQAVGL
jgi:hypothetical protein